MIFIFVVIIKSYDDLSVYNNTSKYIFVIIFD